MAKPKTAKKAQTVKKKPQPFVVLQVRPASDPPDWWPKVALTDDDTSEGICRWATCDPDGGYHMGLDLTQAIPQRVVARVKDDWLLDHDTRQWEFQEISVKPKPSKAKPPKPKSKKGR